VEYAVITGVELAASIRRHVALVIQQLWHCMYVVPVGIRSVMYDVVPGSPNTGGSRQRQYFMRLNRAATGLVSTA
jgi:hypothetical protein